MIEIEKIKPAETDVSLVVAGILLRLGAISLSPDRPFVYSSGMISPIYCDNRVLMSYPAERQIVTRLFCERILRDVGEQGVDVVAATAMSGIPFAAWIAEWLGKPMVFVRPEEKAHGKRQRVEGVLRAGQRAIVIEDSITTARSAISTAEALRAVAGVVERCFAIFTYDLIESADRLRSASLQLSSLCTFDTLISHALSLGKITHREHGLLLAWWDSQNAAYCCRKALPAISTAVQ